MPGRRQGADRYRLAIVDASPLRGVDPRAKLALSLSASLAVMLPLERLALFMAVYVLFLAWARLLPGAARQAWRMKWFLLALFLFDWWLVGLEHAALVVLRLVLLSGVLVLLFGTTTPGEFSLALERLRLPYRYAFSIVLAFQSLALLDDEWRTIYDAQRARGLLQWEGGTGAARLRLWLKQVRGLAALTVPAVVLTTHRAWAVTEAAYARGFNSPHRCPYETLHMRPADWLYMTLALAVIAVLFL